MTKLSRAVLAAASLVLGLLYVTPLWRIQLVAPQYPEGLGIRIWVDRIVGAQPQDLNSINDLNHSIGMRAIEPDAIPELRFMPWILAGLILTGLLAALLGRRWAVRTWLGLVIAGAAAGLADFWKWGYDYGHNLNPRAAIKVPGMSYQPPVVGVKQLLNFQATSWPDVGAWIALAAVAAALWVLWRERTPRAGRTQAT
ncbi:MAG TPA: hypothetical protein VFU45_07070 [Gemmatimonadales bacterium]|nr:hypothetical protein [Gemmatimonadales bacterium]